MNEIIEKYLSEYKEVKNDIEKCVYNYLNEISEVKELSTQLEKYFSDLNNRFLYLEKFEFNITDTKDVMNAPWLYHPKFYSEKSIEIKQNNQFKYIWKNETCWESDEFENYNEISKHISNWTCFDFPKGMSSMLELIKNGFWKLIKSLPILSGKKLNDTNEVYSWDDKYVLIGTTIENIDFVTHDEWMRITKEENFKDFT